MTTEEKLARSDKLRDFERLLDVLYRRENGDEGFGFTWFSPSMEQTPAEKTVKKDEVLRLSSEVQELKNQFNRYLKVEAREESMSQLKEMVAPIREIKGVYAEHKVDRIVFYVAYDKGDRAEIIEKVVDVEIELRKIFSNMKFDFHFFPIKEMPSSLCAEAVYSRRD